MSVISATEADLVLDTIATTRSIRRYTFEDIPTEDLNRILWTATRAPSGTNRQPFRFLVLRQGTKARRARSILGQAFREGWQTKCDSEGWQIDTSERGDTRRERMLQAMQRYVDTIEQVPVIVLALFRRYRPLDAMEGASMFPACQNLLLAARALGYGACFSGWHRAVADQLSELYELPENVEIVLTITLGKPEGNHGPVRRRPIGDLVFEEGWEQAPGWAADPPGTRFTGGGPPSRN